MRVSVPGETLGGDGGSPSLDPGTLVIADERDAVALIFGETADERGVRPRTRRITLCAIQVNGVPDISVEESLWTCADILVAAP